jgi:hypothetical protein
MSETLTYRIYTKGGARAAAVGGRRYAYLLGFIGLRVTTVVEVPWAGASGSEHCFSITIEAAERRVSDQSEASHRYRRVHLKWPNGTNVRTLVEGIDYSDGRRHTMPAGSLGVIAGRVFPNFRVSFPAVPGRTFRYAPQDLEPAP